MNSEESKQIYRKRFFNLMGKDFRPMRCPSGSSQKSFTQYVARLIVPTPISLQDFRI